LSERRGTAFFNLKTAEVEVARSSDAMLRGDTQTSTSQTRRHRRETLRRWRRRAAPRAPAVDEEFVTDLRAASQLDEMGDKFEDIEHEQFGEDGYEDAVKQVDEIEGGLGLSDISQFTAPLLPKT
jgi:hypothetical protein